MRQLLVALPLVWALVACGPLSKLFTVPPTTASGHLVINQALHPKVGILEVQGSGSDDQALEDLRERAASNVLPFTSEATADPAGNYVVAFKADRYPAAFYVYAWDDVDGDGQKEASESHLAFPIDPSGTTDHYTFLLENAGSLTLVMSTGATADVQQGTGFDFRF